MTVALLSSRAVRWLRHELEAKGLAGTVVPRLVNPRTQGWVYGFAQGVGEAFQLSDAERHELEARMFIALFEGSVMGELLGVEALTMAKKMPTLHDGGTMKSDFAAHVDLGKVGAEHFAALERSLETFRATLVVPSP